MTANTSPVLEIRNACRVHGERELAVQALADATIAIQPGEFVAVMGPSGSGKSTLLHLAGGLDVPTAGQVLVEGTDLATLSIAQRAVIRRRSAGYVFQDFNLLPALTAAENVAFPLELDGWSKKKARQAALASLDDTGVAELADRRPEDMSGGQAQRVAIARALVGPRRLLLADEPTGALDSTNGTAVLRLLREKADNGAAVLMVTHEARYAAWTDRTLFLRDGRIIDQSGPSDASELLSQGTA
ncbi:putative ABC-type antimicrobial peptide transport system, ATPase component [Arthrobacter sp. PAMC 25486]|uniref:ABC transporter ATP-binding protein n=1 Tax=Arthrobacter sp. PAMC 25486 TaxID=1494608 RepID=UPI000536358A|nr:ABC transporter ATP-binding protein [Arthrobacter sp. PAMC 25486]AIY01068.1 putative ABC-type antimicrobial peptide transport system, ATPase component [Arthrobacter sp. PAMC 25486]